MTVGPDDPVSVLMHEDVVAVDLGASLRELCETMTDRGIGSVVVLEEGQVTGIVTERDVVAAVADGADPDETSAADVMSEGPICADPEDTIRFTAERMLRAGVRHLPVLGSGDAVGMISARDLFSAFTEQAWAEP
jgi:CBS domain-containing protein